MKKKIYIIHAGGTIGMKPSPGGYEPEPGFLSRQMDLLPERGHPLMPDYEINEYVPLIDSANLSPSDWLKIARDIADHHDAYDGFVILHGTDTMAYTASALPFMLKGLRKPVILTGGQIPLCEIRCDSRENLITAMLIASHFDIPEVCLFFGERLLRGNRSVKTDAAGFNAFDSPNFPALGVAGSRIDIRWDLVLPPPEPRETLDVAMLSGSRVAALRLFPGISEDIVDNVLKPPIRGLVLETYGVGNGPSDNTRLLRILKRASDDGIVIVNCTQCLKGRVEMDAYATGAALHRCGVVSGCDMTAEAALTKMFYLFSQKLTPEVIRSLMQKNLRGELTPPD